MDGGTGLSLREALFLANEDPTTADTITFDPPLANGTIDLMLGQLKIDGSVTIEGGNDDITIDAGGSSRVFDAVAGTSTIDALTMTGGYSNHGGAVSVAPPPPTRLPTSRFLIRLSPATRPPTAAASPSIMALRWN